MGSAFKLAASPSTVLWPLVPSCSADSGPQEAWLPVKIILRDCQQKCRLSKAVLTTGEAAKGQRARGKGRPTEVLVCANMR